MTTTRYGTPTYAGAYRIAYVGNTRYLEMRRGGVFVRIDSAIPEYIRGAYAAASFFKV